MLPADTQANHRHLWLRQRGILSLCGTILPHIPVLHIFKRLQPITANYFTSIGKAAKGIFISLTRQIIFLLPLIVVLPMFLGIEGVMYSAPVADLMAALLALVFVTRELRRMRGMEEEMNCGAEMAD